MQFKPENIMPLGNRVAIKILKNNTNTEAKFYTPIKEEETCMGEIIATSSEAKNLLEGDKIIFNKLSATKLKTTSEEIFIIDTDKILAKIK